MVYPFGIIDLGMSDIRLLQDCDQLHSRSLDISYFRLWNLVHIPHWVQHWQDETTSILKRPVISFTLNTAHSPPEHPRMNSFELSTLILGVLATFFTAVGSIHGFRYIIRCFKVLLFSRSHDSRLY